MLPLSNQPIFLLHHTVQQPIQHQSFRLNTTNNILPNSQQLLSPCSIPSNNNQLRLHPLFILSHLPEYAVSPLTNTTSFV